MARKNSSKDLRERYVRTVEVADTLLSNIDEVLAKASSNNRSRRVAR